MTITTTKTTIQVPQELIEVTAENLANDALETYMEEQDFWARTRHYGSGDVPTGLSFHHWSDDYMQYASIGDFIVISGHNMGITVSKEEFEARGGTTA